MDELAQPDFQQLKQHISNSAHQISLIPNIPSFIETHLITNQLQEIATSLITIKNDVSTIKSDVAILKTDVAALKTDVTTLKTEVTGIGTRMNVNETNTMARLYNSNITNLETLLYPLRDLEDRFVEGFPATSKVLANLNGTNLSNLLQEYSQPVDGSVQEKRKRFRQFIGIMIDV